MKHYILIEVREPIDDKGNVDPKRWGSDMGLIRKSLHKLYDELGLDCADVSILGDRPYTFYGKSMPWAKAAEIMEQCMPSDAYRRRAKDKMKRRKR